MAKVASKPAEKPVKIEEKKEKILIPGQKLDPTKTFPGKAHQISGKIISEEDIKKAVVFLLKAHILV